MSQLTCDLRVLQNHQRRMVQMVLSFSLMRSRSGKLRGVLNEG